MYMIAGTSFGHILNDSPPPRAEERSIFHQLEQAGESWAVFTAAKPSFEEQILPGLLAEKGDHSGLRLPAVIMNTHRKTFRRAKSLLLK